MSHFTFRVEDGEWQLSGVGCQCVPRIREQYDSDQLLSHRVPIDCWTQEDEDRKNLSVYVVAWVGDEDCLGRNDGPIAVYRTRNEAMKRALDEAQQEASERHFDEVEPHERDEFGPDGFAVGRGVCGVYNFMLPKE